ncbi:MAG: type II toxin-antitoxin system VapC family toxin [Treponema sp.]|jgi:PIN domain nuclease of toxin-antitoxin system|nr:type II toxin-antitoxin system VapC family toxin [Treponema sp.]
MQNYLLDACAVLAHIKLEDGWRIVDNLFDRAERGEIRLFMSVVNQVEVFYDRIRNNGIDRTGEIFELFDDLPVTIIDRIDRAEVREAARLKATGGMSLADTFLVAAALHTGAAIVTSDWSELEPVAAQGVIPFLWVRPKPEPS